MWISSSTADPQVGIESTVLSLAESGGRVDCYRPLLLRPGGISRAELEAIIGPVALGAGSSSRSRIPRPECTRATTARARIYIWRPMENCPIRARSKGSKGLYLQHRHPPEPHQRASTRCRNRQPITQPRSMMFSTRRTQGNYSWIAVDLPPHTPEWEAVHDRLQTRRDEITVRQPVREAATAIRTPPGCCSFPRTLCHSRRPHSQSGGAAGSLAVIESHQRERVKRRQRVPGELPQNADVFPLAEITGECPESTFFDCANGVCASFPFASASAAIGAPVADV